MKTPYGESNFKTVVSQGYQYIDKTPYIAKLENTVFTIGGRNKNFAVLEEQEAVR